MAVSAAAVGAAGGRGRRMGGGVVAKLLFATTLLMGVSLVVSEGGKGGVGSLRRLGSLRKLVDIDKLLKGTDPNKLETRGIKKDDTVQKAKDLLTKYVDNLRDQDEVYEDGIDRDTMRGLKRKAKEEYFEEKAAIKAAEAALKQAPAGEIPAVIPDVSEAPPPVVIGEMERKELEEILDEGQLRNYYQREKNDGLKKQADDALEKVLKKIDDKEKKLSDLEKEVGDARKELEEVESFRLKLDTSKRALEAALNPSTDVSSSSDQSFDVKVLPTST